MQIYSDIMDRKQALKLLFGGSAGIREWNSWRYASRPKSVIPKDREPCGISLCGVDFKGRDLSFADLSTVAMRRASFKQACLVGTDFSQCDLRKAVFTGAELTNAKFCKAILSGVNLGSTLFCDSVDFSDAMLDRASFRKAIIDDCQFHHADMRGADLRHAYAPTSVFLGTDLSDANLSGACLEHAHLVWTNLSRATLSRCGIFGVAVWNVTLDDAIQNDLEISGPGESLITIDNIEVAQFISLLRHSKLVREIINTIVCKVVLILGSFSPTRKPILDAIREELRKQNYCPVVFDFERPSSRDTDETISLIARMSRFIIADLSQPRSLPQELKGIVESLPSVPICPIIEKGSEAWGMYEHFKRYPWVMDTLEYENKESLLQDVVKTIITPAERHANKLALQ